MVLIWSPSCSELPASATTISPTSRPSRISVLLSDTQPDPNFARLHRVSFDHLNGQMVNGGQRNRDPAAALGVDIGAGKHADLERGVVGQRYPDMAELGGAIDLRRNQPDPPDQVWRVVAADPHGRARIELQEMDGRNLGIEFDVVVEGDAEHRPGLRRGWRADRGPDLGHEAGARRTQGDRPRSGRAEAPGCCGAALSRASS